VHEYERYGYEARERKRRREHEAAVERIARHARAQRGTRLWRRLLATLRPRLRNRLAGEH
jgi:hypothetical protein